MDAREPWTLRAQGFSLAYHELVSLDFRFGSKAEVQRGPRNVRSWGKSRRNRRESGHRRSVAESRARAFLRFTFAMSFAAGQTLAYLKIGVGEGRDEC